MSDTVGSDGTGAAKKTGGLATPSTKLGWWAVWLMVAFFFMFFINNAIVGLTGSENAPVVMPESIRVLMPYWGILMMGTGVASGIVALVAIITKRDRSWMVWVPIVPLLFVVVFLLGEFLIPH